jgi:hypothetical protein
MKKNKVINGFKICTKCVDNKPLEDYNLDTKGRPQSACKKCAYKLYNSSIQLKKNYQKRKQDPVFVLKSRIRSQVWQYLNGNKSQTTFKLLGWTTDDLVNKLGEKGENLDHKIPISWFKDNTPVNIIWNLNNLQWVSERYNKTKRNSWRDDVNLEYLELVKNYLKDQYQ